MFYHAASAYANSKALGVENFDANYYVSIFGIFEKENEALRREMELLKEELVASVREGKLKDSDIAAYQGLLSRSALDKLSLEEQNTELYKQISKLKDNKLSSMEDKLNRRSKCYSPCRNLWLKNAPFLMRSGIPCAEASCLKST